LLTVALRRLTEPSTRKIAAQEPPSSAGHNDVPHADLARVSMGRDAGQGAYLAAFLSTALDARSPSSSGAAGQFDSVRIASSWWSSRKREASSRKPPDAERLRHCRRSALMAHSLTKLSWRSLDESDQGLIGLSTVDLDYFWFWATKICLFSSHVETNVTSPARLRCPNECDAQKRMATAV
jgi:hypothetical protein